jgi:hypothetical protein
VSGSSIVADTIALVGRERELHRLVTGIMHDDRAAYVVAGPAGVGKTRLVAEVARAATAQGRASLHVVATMAARSIPFGAFAPLLGDVDASPSTLVGALRQAGDAIAARLENRAGLLVIDDAQNLDDGSSALVHHLARDRTCGLITSLRTPGTAPDLVTARWKDGLAVRVDLEPLTEPEVGAGHSGARRSPHRKWGALALGSDERQPAARARAHHGSSRLGRPLAGLRRVGTAEPGSGDPRLVDLVADRLRTLAAPTKEVVELLAVGEPLGFSVVESICTPEGVEDAEQQGLVVVRDQKGRAEASLGHPLYGEVLRQRMPSNRRGRGEGATSSDWRHGSSSRAGPAIPFCWRRRRRWPVTISTSDWRPGSLGPRWGLALGEAELFSGRHAEAEAVMADLATLCATDDERVQVAQSRVHAKGLGRAIGAPALNRALQTPS